MELLRMGLVLAVGAGVLLALYAPIIPVLNREKGRDPVGEPESGHTAMIGSL